MNKELEKEKFTMRFKVTSDKADPNAEKHYIISLDDLYQVATLDNFEKLFHDLKNTFEIALNMEAAIKCDTKNRLKGWEWSNDGA